MKFLKNAKGFSLIELTIVMAISILLVAIVSGVYRLRQQTVNDDAAQQILSQIDLVRNEAQRGASSVTGPVTNPTNNPDTLYGQAIMFSDTCFGAGKSCMAISKLRQTEGSTQLTAYDSRTTDLPEGFKFRFDTSQPNVSLFNKVFPTQACLQAGSCNFTAKPGSTYADCAATGYMMYLTCSPVSASTTRLPVLFIPNPSVSKKMALVALQPGASISTTTFQTALAAGSGNSGAFQLFISNSNNTAVYIITIDLSGSSTTGLYRIQ